MLESSLDLLPMPELVSLLRGLLSNGHDAVRRKALEVFNAKLQGDAADSLLAAKEDALAMLGRDEKEFALIGHWLFAFQHFHIRLTVN